MRRPRPGVSAPIPGGRYPRTGPRAKPGRLPRSTSKGARSPEVERGGAPASESFPPCFIPITSSDSGGLHCAIHGTSLARAALITNQPLWGNKPMTTKTLMMFAAAGLLGPAALEGTASAEITRTVMIHSPLNDKAPVTGTPARLQRTDEEQPGNGMPSFVIWTEGPNAGKGLFFAASTELNGVGANRRVQGSLTTFKLDVNAEGNVVAVPDTTTAKFITNNNGNEYRQFNHSASLKLNDNTGCVTYNYQPNNTNDTRRFIQCFKADGTRVLEQTQIAAKNNDDLGTQASGGSLEIAQIVGNDHYVTMWEGGNGNGRDDGWGYFFKLSDTGTAVTYAPMFDVSLAPREERTRGKC